jgi:hypothetical protein
MVVFENLKPDINSVRTISVELISAGKVLISRSFFYLSPFYESVSLHEIHILPLEL